jgi:hypothetical protein
MNRTTVAAPQTFIGPVVVEKRAGAITSISFHVLQSTSGMLKLEYPDKPTANAARAQLLKSRHTHKVGSNTLLQAIQEALSEAAQNSYPEPLEESPQNP